VSAVDTPPPDAPPETATRRCPRCGSPLTPEQEWCLNCGADVATTIVAPPSWRGPVALVAVLLAVAAAALVLALVELAGDAEQVSQQPAASPTPTGAATVAPTATPESTTIPPASGTGGAGVTPEIADWPAGKEAWTVVLESSATRSAAEARAKELAGQGVPVGILDSDEYGSLEPGRFVVFSGQYDTRRAADQGLQDLSGEVEGAYVRHVAPTP
jgi:septal ring-binding cell division protein DamX